MGVTEKVNLYGKNLSFLYDIKCFCGRRTPHLPFQCQDNENETLASYAREIFDFFDVEQIEEFVAFKGAYEIASLLEKIDNAHYKAENFTILKYCFDNFHDNYYITEYIKKVSPPKGETDALHEPMEDELAETEISLDEKEEESDEQKEEEWSIYSCLPSNESNSSTLTLYDMQQHPWLKKDKNKMSNAFPIDI